MILFCNDAAGTAVTNNPICSVLGVFLPRLTGAVHLLDILSFTKNISKGLAEASQASSQQH